MAQIYYAELNNLLDEGVILPSIRSKVNERNHIEVDFLFPNGILLPYSVDYYSPLDQIKRIIWRMVNDYPLASNLLSENSYNFVFINRKGEKEEVLDESQNMEDLQPFMPIFQLVETKTESDSMTMDKKINKLIGRCLNKQESYQTAEIAHFKQRMNEIGKSITTNRRTQTPMDKFQWRYPLRLRSNWTWIPPEIKSRINNECIVVAICFGEKGVRFPLHVNHRGTPEEVVKAALKKSRTLGRPKDDKGVQYILKVIGQEEYLYGDFALIRFKYVYQCLVKNTAPQFWMIRQDTLPESVPPVPRRPTLANLNVQNNQQDSMKSSDVIIWNVSNVKYRIQFQGISKLQLPNGSKVKLYIGLYHGGEALCKEKETEELTVLNGACDEKIKIEFDIAVADLPPSARLCFALYTIGNSTKRKDLSSWVNIPIYDFKFRLQRGDRELPMWPQDLMQQPDERCYPLGGVALNSSCFDATFLKINLPDVADIGASYLIYPPIDKVLECASNNMEPPGAAGSPTMRVNKVHVEQLEEALYQCDQLCEQEKQLIWMMRHEVRERFPNSLTKVLKSVQWNNHVDVAKMTALLKAWPHLPVDYALEILDYEYPDLNVREFAVECLEDLMDDEISQFMLQLVQALKFENHLYCPLAKFLLSRALNNQHLGHKLFWLLRSETHNPAVTTQYSLILETYLRHNQDHLVVLMQQQEALNKLHGLNSLIKEWNIGDQARRDDAKHHMKTVLNQKTYQKCLSDLFSPLSPLYKMKDLKVDKCKFMNSKKRPLWLVWSNADEMGPEIQIIYKNGDDLRQDMLTLQILQVMDNIWQAEGLDFRMNPYMCMATDLEQGMIEVVSPADTLANIQRWFKRTTFDKRSLYEWLKNKHPSEESLDLAVEEFLMSCAGCCVATYVLGIGDRHNDNIMIKESGQIFHIDFGHFLGNFKSKFHVKRERVPFVLTTHFVHVITKDKTKQENWTRFEQMCEKAFLTLRTKFSLLMSLFMMMLSGGIPQLSSAKDVQYLRETLVPHLSEADARAHFRGKMKEALLGSWKTSLNFWFHVQAK